MGVETFDEDEEERFEKIKMYAVLLVPGVIFAHMLTIVSLKARGKGAPKKKRTAAGMCDNTSRRRTDTDISEKNRIKAGQGQEEIDEEQCKIQGNGIGWYNMYRNAGDWWNVRELITLKALLDKQKVILQTSRQQEKQVKSRAFV